MSGTLDLKRVICGSRNQPTHLIEYNSFSFVSMTVTHDEFKRLNHVEGRKGLNDNTLFCVKGNTFEDSISKINQLVVEDISRYISASFSHMPTSWHMEELTRLRHFTTYIEKFPVQDTRPSGIFVRRNIEMRRIVEQHNSIDIANAIVLYKNFIDTLVTRFRINYETIVALLMDFPHSVTPMKVLDLGSFTNCDYIQLGKSELKQLEKFYQSCVPANRLMTYVWKHKCPSQNDRHNSPQLIRDFKHADWVDSSDDDCFSCFGRKRTQ